MKKTIKIICVTATCIFLGLIAYISFAGRKEKNTEQKYSFYYINSEETKLKEEKYTPEKETAEVMLRDFSESLNNRETREDGISLFPEDVKISSYSIKDGILRLEFNEAYSKMSRTRELLVRTGVVKIFIQIPGIDSVEIYVEKKPLTNSKGEEVGAMNSDTFVEFSGSDGDVYSYDTFTLYFTNKNGQAGRRTEKCPLQAESSKGNRSTGTAGKGTSGKRSLSDHSGKFRSAFSDKSQRNLLCRLQFCISGLCVKCFRADPDLFCCKYTDCGNGCG